MPFQGRLTNLLLHLAESGAFEPVWSDAIHAEWMRNLKASMDIPADRIECRRSEMERAFPAANVPADPDLVDRLQMLVRTERRKKDAHVVATAVAAGASVVVTHNIQDFDPVALGLHDLSRTRPDPFCASLLASRQEQVLAGVRAHRASLRKTPMAPADYVAHLADDKLGRRQAGPAQAGSRPGAALAPHLSRRDLDAAARSYLRATSSAPERVEQAYAPTPTVAP